MNNIELCRYKNKSSDSGGDEALRLCNHIMVEIER